MEYFNDPLNQQRFIRRLGFRINDDDHWFWNSMVFKRTKGYKIPFLWVKLQDGGQKQVYARRFAYEMEYGKLLDSDSNVINVCGEQMCVKPHEKHNIAVRRGSWNTRGDKLEYQLRQGIETVSIEPTVTHLGDGSIVVSTKHMPIAVSDGIDRRVGDRRAGIPSEEEFLNGKK